MIAFRRRWFRTVVLSVLASTGALAFRSAAAEPDAARPRPVVCVTDEASGRGDVELLPREIVRQAFFLAARHAIGARTLDASLRETPTAAQESHVPWSVLVDYQAGKRTVEPIVNLGRGVETRCVFQWKYDLPAGESIEVLTTWAEMASREIFTQGLTKEFPGAAPYARKESAPVPKEVEEGLRELTFVSQLEALRRLHLLLEADGESPERLEGLARGYAQLGLLTGHLWTDVHQIMVARSLLYAERLRFQRPEEARSRWCRGFARALAGRHHMAWNDFDAARALDAKAKTTPPAWALLAEAHVHFEPKILENPADPREKPLAAWLLYMLHDLSRTQEHLEAQYAALLKAVPDPYRALDRVGDPDRDYRRYSFLEAVQPMVASNLYPQLSEVDDLPEKAAELCAKARTPLPSEEEYPLRGRLMDALRTSALNDAPGADGGEFGWRTWATLIEDLSLVHAGRATNHIDTSKEVLGLMKRHPCKPFFDLVGARGAEAERVIQAIRKFDTRHLNMNARPLFARLSRYDDQLGLRLSDQVFHRADMTSCQQAQVYLLCLPGYRKEVLGRAFHFGPRQTIQVGGRLMNDPAAAKREIADWETRYVGVPDVTVRLGNYYFAAGDDEKAVRFYRQAMKEACDREPYLAMAHVFVRQGDDQGWLDLHHEYLDRIPKDHPDRVGFQNNIARFLTARRRWKEALPYVEAGISTGTAWSLANAGGCCEALGDWEAAEACFRTISEQERWYPLAWYFFCRRTGRGDLQAARLLAEERRNQPPLSERKELPLWEAVYELLDRRFEPALDKASPIAARSADPAPNLLAALLLDRLGKPAERDAQLLRTLTAGATFVGKKDDRPDGVELVLLAQSIRDDLAAGGKGKIDLAEAAKRVRSAGAETFAEYYALLGEYLDLHEQPDAAIECWKRAMACSEISNDFRSLAGARLADCRIGPAEYREALQTPRTSADLRVPPPLPLRRPADAVAFGGKFYKLVLASNVSWTESRRQAEFLGGGLACVTSPEEHQLTVKIAQGKKVWLGARKDGDAWKWISGEPFSYQAFDGKGQRGPCLRLMGHAAWWAEPDETKYVEGYIVEWKGE